MESLLPILLPALALAGASGLLLCRERWAIGLWAGLSQLAILGVAGAILAETWGGAYLVHAVGGWQPPEGIAFVADRLAALFATLIAAVAAAAVAYALLDTEPNSRSRSMSLVFLLQAGMLGAVLTGDIFDFYVFFELLGIASYSLVAYRGEKAHVEAGLKYAALSLTGSMLMLMGIGALYAQTGALSFAAIHEASFHVASPPLYLLALSLIFIALCLKAAIFPFHFWLPDAHSIAPTAISMLLSGAVVKVGAYGILRVLASQAPWVWEQTSAVLLPAAAATALLAALMAAAQRDLKRLLAYSTVSQMGYVVTAASLGTTAGVSGAVTYSVIHGLTKTCLFVVAGVAIDASGERRWDRMGGGRLPASPLFVAAALVCSLSLAGLPPFAGFTGKLAVFRALVEAGAWFSTFALVSASLVILAVIGRAWLEMFLPGAAPGRVGTSPKAWIAISLAVAIVGLGAAPGPLIGAADRAAAALFYWPMGPGGPP